MTKKTTTQAVTSIVKELSEFTSDERHRIVQASLMLLGEASVPQRTSTGADGEEAEDNGLPAKARSWMKQHNLTLEQLNQVFHFGDNGIDIIASIPGATKKQQVQNAYVLLGVARLLASGETKFDDMSARELCESGGFFDHTNHMKAMKGSEFTGSREKGWVLTAPGLKHGASLVVELSKD
jgi:hypothetical protein